MSAQTAPSALPYRPCVGIVLRNDAGQIWAGQRIDGGRIDGLSYAWQMPQGGIDEGEAPLGAAYRELEEETGVTRDLVTLIAQSASWQNYDLPAELVGKLWKGRYRGQRQKWFLLHYHGEDKQVNIAGDSPEFSVWAWKTPADVLANVVPFKREVYTRVLGEFEQHLNAAP